MKITEISAARRHIFVIPFPGSPPLCLVSVSADCAPLSGAALELSVARTPYLRRTQRNDLYLQPILVYSTL